MANLTDRTRRRPEQTVLYRLVQEHLQTFCERIASADADTDGRSSLPRFVERELRDFLACGVLARGFCRLHCDACGEDELVAFSCKRRGFCPSCCGRRMADTAAFLVDELLPDVPVRQWVLSLPHSLRVLCANDQRLLRSVRTVFVRTVSRFLQRRAERGLARVRAGAVVFIQRFDSALRLDVHFHALFADGVFACDIGQARADFHPTRELCDADVAHLVRRIRDGVHRLLRRLGKLEAPDDPAFASDEQPLDALQQIHAAAMQGKTALGPAAGRLDLRPGRGSLEVTFRHGPGSLCADLDGFSLHAATWVPAGRRDRLEHLIRYVTRPPIANDRLAVLPDGRVAYALKKRWRDGSTHVVLDPLTFLERLAALVPRPRKKLVTYHGVFAPAAAYRHRVVPPPREGGGGVGHAPAGGSHCCAPASGAEQRRSPTVPTEPAMQPQDLAEATADVPTPSPLPKKPQRQRVPHAPRKPPRRRRYYFWSELLRRVFLIDALTCPRCAGTRRLLTFLTDQAVIQRILHHLGLPAEPPEIAPARPPPARSVRFTKA